MNHKIPFLLCVSWKIPGGQKCIRQRKRLFSRAATVKMEAIHLRNVRIV